MVDLSIAMLNYQRLHALYISSIYSINPKVIVVRICSFRPNVAALLTGGAIAMVYDLLNTIISGERVNHN